MDVALVYSPALADYSFGASHPLRPERFTLAVELAEAWGLVGQASRQAPLVGFSAASIDDLLSVHDADYVDIVQAASADPARFTPQRGIGPGDTPAFAGMHEAFSLATGATAEALRLVVAGDARRAFVPAGGLHHAHRDHAAGFCVYNDPAVAIALATRDNPGLRVAYVDIDAHHGDGVEEAFVERADVLTVSVHESGRYLFPGTGPANDIGEGPGLGFALNLPMPPNAGDEEYAHVFDAAIAPAVRAFAPDVIVAQLGADTHRNDPLAHLDVTVAGHHALVCAIVELANEVCAGKLVATGGGGYDTFSAVPRAWACALAALLDVGVPEELPASWRHHVTELAPGFTPPCRTFEEQPSSVPDNMREDTRMQVERMLETATAASPLLGG